jgi:hypothetical protein
VIYATVGGQGILKQSEVIAVVSHVNTSKAQRSCARGLLLCEMLCQLTAGRFVNVAKYDMGSDRVQGFDN